MAATDFFKIGQISGGQAPDIAGSFSEGLEAGLKPFFDWQKKEKAWKESVAPKLAKIGEDYSPTLVDEGQRATMTAALQESRLKYADILKQTRNMDPTSEEYISLMGQATDIVAGFNKTFELGQEFTQLGNEFALLAQNDNLSRGMTSEKRAGLSQIFVNGKYKVKRDPVTGQMTYIVTENIKGSEPEGDLNIAGMEFTHDELDDFRQPNQTFVNGYLAINENFSKLGEGGKKLNTESAEYKSSAFELQKAISNMSIEELRSLATDNFLDGNPIAVFSKEEGNIFNMTKEQLGPMVYKKLMNNLLATNATNYQPPTPPQPKVTEFDKKYTIDTDNIAAAAEQMYLNNTIPDSLPGIGSSTLNTRQDVINAELEAQQAAIVDGTLSEDDALTPSEISDKYPAPYYTSDLRPVKSIRQALSQLYEADENQIRSALQQLANIEDYDPSKLLFSGAPSGGNGSLPPLPPKNEITQVTQLTGEYAYAKNYLDSIQKIINEINEASILPEGRIGFPRFRRTKVEERNNKIAQAKTLKQALEKDFPNLELTNIQIPTPQ